MPKMIFFCEPFYSTETFSCFCILLRDVFSGFNNWQKPGNSKHSSCSHFPPLRGPFLLILWRWGLGLESVKEGLLAGLSPHHWDE